MSDSFSVVLEKFSLSIDTIDEDSFDRVMSRIEAYVRESLNFDRINLWVDFRSNGGVGLRSAWTSDRSLLELYIRPTQIRPHHLKATTLYLQ